jgi:toxin ParE1/3/4
MATVRRTVESQRDYLKIFVYIGEQNLAAAVRLIQMFDDKLDMLAEMPGLGPARPELGKGLRSFPVGAYVLIYRPSDDGIELLRAVHGARNLRKLFRRR